MTTTILEIHVPLRRAPGIPDSEYGYPWIDDIEEFLSGLEEQGEVEVFDDGEEFGDVYIFFITGGTEDALLHVASRAAALDRVPAGVFAMITDDAAPEFGLGRRADLPSS